MKVDSNSKIKEFYDALATSMKENNMRFIWSSVKQENVGLSKTIFIPFDANDHEDKDGYGLYLYINEIQAPDEVSHCIVATAVVKIANTQYKKDLSRLLHEINFRLTIPGWILDDKDNLLLFKYLFPIHEGKKIPKAYLTLIFEVFNGITQSFPLLKEVIEGRLFKEIRDEVESRLTLRER